MRRRRQRLIHICYRRIQPRSQQDRALEQIRNEIKAPRRYPFKSEKKRDVESEQCTRRNLEVITRQPASRMQIGRARSLAFWVQPTKQRQLTRQP